MRRTALTLAAAAAIGGTADAQLFDIPKLGIFRKKDPKPAEPAPNPAAPQGMAKAKPLIDTLQRDPDEKKRIAAAEELKDADPRGNPDVLTALAGSLKADPSPAVRSAAAKTLGEIKPVSATAGVALEQTVTTDPSDDVRKAAQAALWQYHLNGYRSAGANPAYPQTAEPPAAKPKSKQVSVPVMAPPPASAQPRPITQGIGKGAVYPQTVEPPLAKPKVTPPTPTLAVPAVERPAVVTIPGVPDLAPPTVTIPTPPVPLPVPTIPPPPGSGKAGF